MTWGVVKFAYYSQTRLCGRTVFYFNQKQINWNLVLSEDRGASEYNGAQKCQILIFGMKNLSQDWKSNFVAQWNFIFLLIYLTSHTHTHPHTLLDKDKDPTKGRGLSYWGGQRAHKSLVYICMIREHCSGVETCLFKIQTKKILSTISGSRSV